MLDLNSLITDYSDWEHPWNFKSFVLQNSELSEVDVAIFNNAWDIASSSELWRTTDIVLCCKCAHNSLRVNAPSLSEMAMATIVRAVSYEWR
jgi:hypothetical protein